MKENVMIATSSKNGFEPEIALETKFNIPKLPLQHLIRYTLNDSTQNP